MRTPNLTAATNILTEHGYTVNTTQQLGIFKVVCPHGPVHFVEEDKIKLVAKFLRDVSKEVK